MKRERIAATALISLALVVSACLVAAQERAATADGRYQVIVVDGHTPKIRGETLLHTYVFKVDTHTGKIWRYDGPQTKEWTLTTEAKPAEE